MGGKEDEGIFSQRKVNKPKLESELSVLLIKLGVGLPSALTDGVVQQPGRLQLQLPQNWAWGQTWHGIAVELTSASG